METYERPIVAAPKTLRAGQVAEWEITSNNVTETNNLEADADRIVVTFSSGTVPSGITRDDILVRTSDTGAGDNGDTPASARLSVAPTVSGKTISFLSPVDSAVSSTVRIVISATAGIAAGNSPGPMAVTVKLGTSIAATSAPVNVGRYLSFSPATAARNATVTVSGGGFTAGTSGGIKVGDTAGVGTYTVDSSGKLSGSFVASSKTSAGGPVSVQDLGTGAPVVSTSDFDQTASATPASTEVTRGASLSVSLSDFPMAGAEITATIVDQDATVSPSTGTVGIPVPSPGTGTDGTMFAADKTSGTVSIAVSQDTTPGTKRVTVSSGDESARFLITIVSRTLTVSPSSAVPGQAVTVSGSGFNNIASVDLMVTGHVNAAGDAIPVEGGDDIKVNTDGTFLYTGRVPFNAETAKDGSKTWTAAGGTRAATSSGFTIQKRAITLSPSTANPGTTVEIFGSGWGVKTNNNATSQVMITVTGSRASFGPFPISSSGEFTGAFTVPSDSGVSKLTVTATDNNGTESGNGELTQGFPDVASEDRGNQSATKSLTVPTGIVTVNPNTASTGSIITVTGKGFPSQTNLSVLEFGDSNALPVPAPGTDVEGNFTVTLTVPAAPQGGSLTPGAVVITAGVGKIEGTTSFTIPGPEVSLSIGEARPGDEITITGNGFSAYSNVDTVNIGKRNQTPTPNPLTDAVGNFSATVRVPALNPGAYTVTVRTGSGFTATESIRILSATSGRTVSPEIAFQALTSRGLLTLAAAAAPGGTEFGAFVPGLAGNTLVQVEPNGVLILTLNADAQISVSSQPAVNVSADTPTFFAIGAAVTVEVIE